MTVLLNRTGRMYGYSAASGAASLTFSQSVDDVTAYTSGSTNTVTGVIPSAGTFVIAWASVDSTSTSDIQIDVAGVVTAATEIHTVSGNNAAAKLWWVTASGAGDISVTHPGVGGTSFASEWTVMEATGLTNAGAITASAAGTQATDPATCTLTSVPTGHWVVSVALFRSTSGAVAWGGTFASGDEVFDDDIGATAHRASVALVEAATGGSNFTTTATITGDDGIFFWVICSAALAPA